MSDLPLKSTIEIETSVSPVTRAKPWRNVSSTSKLCRESRHSGGWGHAHFSERGHPWSLAAQRSMPGVIGFLTHGRHFRRRITVEDQVSDLQLSARTFQDDAVFAREIHGVVPAQ